MAFSKADRRLIEITGCGKSNGIIAGLRKAAKEKLNNPNATNEDIELYYTQNPNWRTAKENKSVTGNAIEVQPADSTASNEALPVTQNNDDLVAAKDSVTCNAQQHNSIQSVEALPVTQPKKRNKVKRFERATGLKRISFGGTGNTKRYHITLEAEYVEALKKITPTINEWLLGTVAKYPDESESPTRIIKTQIVKTLLSMIRKNDRATNRPNSF